MIDEMVDSGLMMNVCDLVLLAQANPENVEITPGQTLSGVLVLMLMAASLATLVTWYGRWQRNECLIPSAETGFLRVPVPLMLLGLVLALLVLALVVTQSLMPADSLPGDVAVVDSLPEEPPTDLDDRQQKLMQLRMALQQTLIFNLGLLAIFGFGVLHSRLYGRVALPADLLAAQFPPAHPLAQADYIEPADPGIAELSGSTAAASRSNDPYRRPDVPFPEATGSTAAAFLAGEFRWAGEVFLAAYLPTTILKVLLMVLVRLITGEPAPSHPFLEMMGDGIDWIIFAQIAVMAAIVAPLVEELFYRVVILGGLVQIGRVWEGLLISTSAFCLAHGFPDSLALLPLALALGYTYIQRRSYLTVVLVHFLFNAFNLLVAGLAMPA